MLYTFSQPDYNEKDLTRYITEMRQDDVVVLWQDGVLLLMKYPHLLQQLPCSCCALAQDLEARHLTAWLKKTDVRAISLFEFVQLSEQYAPQIAL